MVRIIILVCSVIVCSFTYGQSENRAKTIIATNGKGQPQRFIALLFTFSNNFEHKKYIESDENGFLTFNIDSSMNYYVSGAVLSYVGMHDRIIDFRYEGLYEKDTLHVKMLDVDSLIKDYIRWGKPKK